MIKNATVYTFADDATRKAMWSLGDHVTAVTAKDPDKTQWSTLGFTGIAAIDEDAPVFTASDGTKVFTVQLRERVLPGKVIRVKMKERADEYYTRQGYRPGRKAMAEIKDMVISELLPSAFVRPNDTVCLVTRKYLILGTTSAKMVDAILALLRSSMPNNMLSFQRLPQGIANKVESFMTNSLLGGGGDIFELGNSVVLKGADKSSARFKDMALEVDAVVDSINQDMVPVEIELTYAEKVSFSMTDQLVFKRIRLADILTEQANEDSQGEAASYFDATVAIVAGTLSAMITDLVKDIAGEDQGDEL